MVGHAKVKTRREHLTRLYLARVPFRVIAQEYGGTPQGVRSTVRKMRERGVLPDRQQPRGHNPNPKRDARGRWA